MATPNFIHGKLSTITIAGTHFAALSVSWDEDLSDLTDITYTIAGGQTFGTFLPGYNIGSGDISFVYDSANQPTLAPQNMIPGTLMTIVLTPDGTKPYTMTAWSGKFHWAGGPRSGPVMCSTHFQSTGPFTRPTS